MLKHVILPALLSIPVSLAAMPPVFANDIVQTELKTSQFDYEAIKNNNNNLVMKVWSDVLPEYQKQIDSYAELNKGVATYDDIINDGSDVHKRIRMKIFAASFNFDGKIILISSLNYNCREDRYPTQDPLIQQICPARVVIMKNDNSNEIIGKYEVKDFAVSYALSPNATEIINKDNQPDRTVITLNKNSKQLSEQTYIRNNPITDEMFFQLPN
jgi:hypothetical protein